MPYTVKAFLEGTAASAQLFTAEDLEKAKEKAEELRAIGHVVEIWQNDGTKVSTLEAPFPTTNRNRLAF